MNNMLEYMTGGQCYKCGGKVRYADGGENMEGQSPMGQQSQNAAMPPQHQPSTLDASAKQLMTFLLDQLSKGTSERILRKTLTDSGVKSEQADELLAVAKQEFDKTISEGDYSTSEQERQIEMQARQQQMAQQQMGMMNQAGPGAGMDPSMMAMNQEVDQSALADGEIQEGRFGGSMRRLRRMNMGGQTCPDGLMWSDAANSCIPTATTANMMQAGAGPVNIGGANAIQTQNSVKQTSDTYNQNMLLSAEAQDKNRNLEGSYYDKLLNTAQTKRSQGFDNSLGAMGAIHEQMMQGQLPFQKKPVTPAIPVTPIGTNITPEPAQGYTQDFGTTGNARFGGLARFLGGGTNGFNPTDVKQYISDLQSKATMSVDDPNNIGTPQGYGPGILGGASPNLAQLNQYVTGMQDKMTMSMPEKTNDANNNNNNNNKDAAPIDPRLTNSPYIVRTDKNKIANLDNNWVNKALAVGSNLGSAQTLGATGAFGPYLQMLLGATGAVSSAALGAKKLFAGTKRTVYDDKGNVFEYDNKRSYRDAGRGDSQNQGGAGSQTATGNIPNTGVNEDIPKGMMMQTNIDKYGQPVGINRRGQLASYDNPLRNHERQMGTDEEGNPIMDKYGDNDRLNSMLDLSGKTRKDFRAQGPALFGENKYGTAEDLKQDYEDAGYFGKMQQRQQFKRDAAWDPNLSNSDESNEFLNKVNPPAVEVKEDGGEWNPFTDNRRKLRIGMPMYGPGGPINNETTPYTQQEWAQVQSKTFPLKPEDIQPYNDYVASFNNTAGNQTNLTTTQPNMTNNANNALSANPNANMVDTKEYTVDRGDALGARVAQNLYSGLAGWNAGAEEIQGRKRIKEIGKKRQEIGNSMEIGAVNPINMYGSWMTNATQGSNYDLANQGATQDWQTTLNAKFGGSMYRRGGTYNLSPQELQAIIAMGGEVEFLD